MKEFVGLLQNCALSVCPYTDATQSGVIMTSYSLCKPVVATNVGGLGEMVEEGKTGTLVPPKNVAALSDAIMLYSKMKQSVRKWRIISEMNTSLAISHGRLLLRNI